MRTPPEFSDKLKLNIENNSRIDFSQLTFTNCRTILQGILNATSNIGIINVSRSVEHFDWTGKIIHPFCTHEGSGIGKSEIHVAQSARGATVKPGLAVQGCMVDESREAIEKWCGR